MPKLGLLTPLGIYQFQGRNPRDVTVPAAAKINGNKGFANFRENFREVFPSNLARAAAKLWENAFQTTPDASFFDTEKKKCKYFSEKKSVFLHFRPFLRSYAKTDDTGNFPVKFCSRLT